jgi:hypothetical protein
METAGEVIIYDEAYLPEQRSTASRVKMIVGNVCVTTDTAYLFDRDTNMRKTKKKQLMIMAKALYLNQPKGSTFTLRQIIQRLKDVVKQKG